MYINTRTMLVHTVLQIKSNINLIFAKIIILIILLSTQNYLVQINYNIGFANLIKLLRNNDKPASQE